MPTKAKSFTLMDNSISPRKGFIGKELDSESNLADHGVRKYDYITGRFMAVDPLWEEYKAFNTYQYAANNPILLFDRNGKHLLGPLPEFENQLVSDNETGAQGQSKNKSKKSNSNKKNENPTVNFVVEGGMTASIGPQIGIRYGGTSGVTANVSAMAIGLLDVRTKGSLGNSNSISLETNHLLKDNKVTTTSGFEIAASGIGASFTSEQVRDNKSSAVDSDINTFTITGGGLTMEYKENKTDSSVELFLGYKTGESQSFIFNGRVDFKAGISIKIP
jgi:RHS repeat-associated protein